MGGEARAVLAAAVLLLSRAGAQAPCPGAAETERTCGGAKAASVGNCLVCLAQHSQFSSCSADAMDSFCSGIPSPALVFGSCKDAAHDFMDCRGAASCAVLVLETGNGDGYYSHDSPSVHGLWPQSGQYGNSACVLPKTATTVPGFLPPCYDNDESQADLPHQLSFIQHEWEKHGACSGAADEAGYFNNICALARQGTQLMDKTKPLQSIANTLHDAGLPVYCVDTSSSQIYISACASRSATGDLHWEMVAQEDFATECDLAVPEPAPAPEPGADQCIEGAHGPPCGSDSDCEGYINCLRCAHSGFCTMQPRS